MAAMGACAAEYNLKEWLLQAPGCYERLGFPRNTAAASALSAERTDSNHSRNRTICCRQARVRFCVGVSVSVSVRVMVWVIV